LPAACSSRDVSFVPFSSRPGSFVPGPRFRAFGLLVLTVVADRYINWWDFLQTFEVGLFFFAGGFRSIVCGMFRSDRWPDRWDQTVGALGWTGLTDCVDWTVRAWRE
jgi:hypothetical protein